MGGAAHQSKGAETHRPRINGVIAPDLFTSAAQGGQEPARSDSADPGPLDAPAAPQAAPQRAVQQILPGTAHLVGIVRPSLADRFIVPPFSVLDARQGYWQDRKRQWLSLGIQSELGRGDSVGDGHRTALHDSERYATPADRQASYDSNLPVGRDPGLTWGTGVAMADPQLNYYRRQNAATRESQRLAPGGGGGAWLGGPVTGSTPKFRNSARAIHDHEWQAEHLDSIQAPPAGTGTSIFDPVICELVYRWFCPPNGIVLDPFAGGSVRGIVAAALDCDYVGIDLSERQLTANREQAAVIIPERSPCWLVGDALEITRLDDDSYDLVFTCPPYGDLERYSDDPRDLSAMEYPEFLAAYRRILAQCVGRLRHDRFAVVVVGDIRDRFGNYRGLPGDTIAAFQAAGAVLYNQAVLITAAGSLPIRAGKQFEAGRKLGNTHQHVLVFLHGDPKRASAACGPAGIEWGSADQ